MTSITSSGAINKPGQFLKMGWPFLSYGLFFLANLFCLYLVVALYAQNQTAFALLVLVVVTSASWVILNKKSEAARYIYPSLFGIGVFVIFPLLYTLGIGFSNYSAENLLSFERVQEILLSEQTRSGDQEYPFALYSQADGSYLLEVKGDTEFFSAKWNVENEGKVLQLAPQLDVPASEKLPFKQVIKLRKSLDQLTLVLPDQSELVKAGLRTFAPMINRYRLEEDGKLFDQLTQEPLIPDWETGFYRRLDGSSVTPGFTVYVGLDNFLKVLTDASIRGPFLQIFAWTLTFSSVTVFFVLILGLVLANLLQWKPLKGKKIYRMLLILPYAVPAFISILTFKGLFNQNFGEINMVLNQLFGVSPDWFSDPMMAKIMILIVNVWLGYPYIMLLCTGLLQSISDDLYEASALDGAGPIDNLLKITLPLVIKPLTPLLIACFAYNFNNFVVISLLTEGNPDIIGASTPAGTTDLLVSYTYRIAFQDSGQNFGLAAAIATLIFIVVGALALLNLKLTKVRV